MTKHPLEALSELYLASKKIKATTLKSYRIAFRQFMTYLKENEIVYPKTSDIIRYREQKRALGYSSAYLYIQISAFKGLYRYLRIHQKALGLSENYAYDIMGPIKNERIKPALTKPILSAAQAKQLLLKTKVRRKYLWHYRDHAIVYLMLTGGLSRYDITHACRASYIIKNGQALLYLPAFEDEENFIKLSRGAKKALDDYLHRRKDNNPYLFISHKKVSPSGHLSRCFFRRMFRGVLKACDLQCTKITPHALRHTAAILNLQRGASLAQTKLLLRHKHISSTKVYADYLARLQNDSELEIDRFILSEKGALAWLARHG